MIAICGADYDSDIPKKDAPTKFYDTLEDAEEKLLKIKEKNPNYQYILFKAIIEVEEIDKPIISKNKKRYFSLMDIQY